MELVEGTWTEFEFRRATSGDVGLISQLLRTSYFPDEPLSILLQYSEDYVQDFEKVWSTFLDDDLSFLAIHKESGKIAGVRMAFNRQKNMNWSKYDLVSSQTAAVMTCVKMLDEQSHLFERYGLDNYIELFMTCVDPQFRKLGLVSEMYRRAISLAKAKGFFLAKACFSSPFSRRAAANLGFKESARVYLKTARDSESKELLFPSATDQDVLTQSILILSEYQGTS